MQFKAIGGVAVGDLSLKVGGQVDDIDGTKRTFFRTYTAANAKAFGYEGNLGIWSNFDAQLASPHNRTGLLAFLTAFLRAGLVLAGSNAG